MKKVTPAENPEAYVGALDSWRRDLVQALRTAVRETSAFEERIKWGHLVCIEVTSPHITYWTPSFSLPLMRPKCISLVAELTDSLGAVVEDTVLLTVQFLLCREDFPVLFLCE